MSGPIVRKYGFPNFEKIFGDRPIQHGVEDESNAKESTPAATSVAANVSKEDSKSQETEKSTG